MAKQYLIFTLPSCSKCPGVKKYMEGQGMEGREINASSEEGLEKAQEHNVMSTPTVIIFNEAGEELCRGGSIEELQKCLSK